MATLRSRGNASSVSAGMWSCGTENYGVGRGAGEAGSVCATNLKYAVVKAAAANGTVRLCATSEPSQMSRKLGRGLKSRRMIVEAIATTRNVMITSPNTQKSTRLNSSHVEISYAVFCLKK